MKNNAINLDDYELLIEEKPIKMNKSIILLGIKHSGKSTQGLLLSKELNCPWVDIDEKSLN